MPGDTALLFGAAGIIVALIAVLVLDGFVIARLIRRNRVLEQFALLEHEQLEATRSQLRLAHAELRVPKPFGDVMERMKRDQV